MRLLAIVVAVVLPHVVFVQQSLAWTQSFYVIIISRGDFASARTSASSPSTEGNLIDQLGVGAHLYVEGVPAESDTNLCNRGIGQSVSCAAEATSTPLTPNCEYCNDGIAIAFWQSNTYEEVQGFTCNTYDPP